MSEPLPPPSTIVVFSLSITIRLARPRSLMVTFSSLMPRSSVKHLPPVRMAMSSRIALRRSPKPGALTATTFSVPRILLTTRAARASPSTSSAMIRRGLSNCMPSTTSRVVSMDFASSTVMVPSLPTLSMASAMMLPIVSSQLAETVATWRISSRSETFLETLASSATAASTALSMPRFRAIGLAPAATVLTPSR